jgi:MFS family permease
MFYKQFKVRSVAGNARALNVFSLWFCLRFYSAVAVIYFARITHSYVLAVSVLIIMQLSQGIFEVPTGIMSDRIGRVWCMRVGLVASLLSVACYLGGHYAWLVAGATLEGLWRALFSGNNEALLYESVKEEGRLSEFHTYLGSLNVAMEVAGFVAAVAGGLLAAISFHLALWLTAAVQLPALIASFYLVEPKKHAVRAPNPWLHVKEALLYMRRNQTLRRLSLAQIMTEGFATFELWPAFYNQFVPVWAVGAMVSANYLESAIGFRMSGWFMRRFRAMSIILFSDIYSKIMMFAALIVPSVISTPLMALAGAPYGPFTIATGTLMHQEFTDHQRATMASGLFAVFGLILGAVADHFGAGRAILLGQVCLLPVTCLYWLMRRQKDMLLRGIVLDITEPQTSKGLAR